MLANLTQAEENDLNLPEYTVTAVPSVKTVFGRLQAEKQVVKIFHDSSDEESSDDELLEEVDRKRKVSTACGGILWNRPKKNKKQERLSKEEK